VRNFFDRKPVRIITFAILSALAIGIYWLRESTGNSLLELLFP
jgi:hypothetical protein